MTNTSNNQSIQPAETDVPEFKEMPKLILQLIDDSKFFEAFRLAPFFLARMLDEGRTEFLSKSNLAEMIKLYIKLLSLSRIGTTACKFIEAEATVKLIETAHEDGLVDDKTMFALHSKAAEVQAHMDKKLLIVAKDKFIEGGDFKVGQYKTLWRTSRLVDAPKSDVIAELLTQFPWMITVTVSIMKQIRAREFGTNQAFKIRPILLVGAPGSGKTSYCNALSKTIGVPFRTFMAAGSESSIAMRGVARGYSTASPGFVPRFIAQENVANGLILVDELDKCSTGKHNGSLLDVMLQLLEPATSSSYYDEALEVRLDLSHVNWIATANSLGAIPKPLLSRFEVILAGEPDATGYAQAIIKTREDYADELGIDVRMLPILDGEDIDWLTPKCKSLREIARVTKSILEDRMSIDRPMIH